MKTLISTTFIASFTVSSCVASGPDHSGLSDLYESIYFTGIGTPNIDADSDGVTNFEEMLWGTDPTDRLSAVRAPLVTLTDTELRVTWPVSSYRIYQLQASSDLETWQTVASGSVGVYREPLTIPASSNHRFYRLSVNLDTTDRDGNGLADWEEALYQQVTGHPLNSTADTDQDGLPDVREFAQGLNFLKKDHPAVGLIVFTPLEK